MTWVKLSDTALDEPFLLDLPRGAILLHLEALAYSNRYGTDGVIHRAALRKITTEEDPEAAVELLCRTQMPGHGTLWAPIENGWQLFWLLGDQPKSDEIEASREFARQRQERKRLHNKGNHDKCDPKRCKYLLTRDTPRDDTRDKRPSPVPSRPDPPRPVGERGGESRNGDAGPVVPVAVRDKEEELGQRRQLARAIREAPDDLLRQRYRRSFEKQFGVLYGRQVAS